MKQYYYRCSECGLLAIEDKELSPEEETCLDCLGGLYLSQVINPEYIY